VVKTPFILIPTPPAGYIPYPSNTVRKSDTSEVYTTNTSNFVTLKSFKVPSYARVGKVKVQLDSYKVYSGGTPSNSPCGVRVCVGGDSLICLDAVLPANSYTTYSFEVIAIPGMYIVIQGKAPTDGTYSGTIYVKNAYIMCDDLNLNNENKGSILTW